MNEILIYSDIGQNFFEESITASTIKEALAGMAGDVAVRINSPGGDVFEGLAIFNLLDQHEGKVTVHVDGLAASAASVIAMGGDEIIMADNSLMMIHDPWTMNVGNAAEMRETADLLDKISGSLVTTYASKSNLDPEDIAAKMKAETWLSAAEAVTAGLATSVSSESVASVGNMAKPWIKNMPQPEQASPDEEKQTAWRLAANRRRLALIN